MTRGLGHRSITAHHNPAIIRSATKETELAEAALIENATSAAKCCRIYVKLEFVDQSGGDQCRGEACAAKDGYVSALLGFQSANLAREVSAAHNGALPA